MLNHPEYCYYNPVVGMQNTSDESDEATSHPIERVPSRFGAAAGREIVYVDTLEHKAVDDNTAFVLGGLVIEKVPTDVSFYVGCAYCKKRIIVADHGNLRCERHACVNGNTYFVVRVCFVESATGRSIWLTLFDQCMAGLLDVDAKDFSVMHESMQIYKFNTLIETRLSLTIKKSKRTTSTITTTTIPTTTAAAAAAAVAAATTTSACNVNITIDYPGNEMKKTLASHIAYGVAELSKLRCYGCEIDHPSQSQHDCLLPNDTWVT